MELLGWTILIVMFGILFLHVLDHDGWDGVLFIFGGSAVTTLLVGLAAYLITGGK
jgi:hypothetical protein